MKWYYVCSQCDEGQIKSYAGMTTCARCKGTGKRLAYRSFKVGALVRLTESCQPSQLSNAYVSVNPRNGMYVRVRRDSTALVLGNRLNEIDKTPNKTYRWQGHDVLCLHSVYGLCWLPSDSMVLAK